jgi:hypothetical protein
LEGHGGDTESCGSNRACEPWFVPSAVCDEVKSRERELQVCLFSISTSSLFRKTKCAFIPPITCRILTIHPTLSLLMFHMKTLISNSYLRLDGDNCAMKKNCHELLPPSIRLRLISESIFRHMLLCAIGRSPCLSLNSSGLQAHAVRNTLRPTTEEKNFRTTVTQALLCMSAAST